MRRMPSPWFWTLALVGWLLCCGDEVRADYRSLTPAERAIVDKAFEQAKFYQYYEALAVGADSIEVEAVQHVSSSRIDDQHEDQVHDLTVRLMVRDKVFRRVMRVTMRIRIQPEGWSLTRWLWTGSGWAVAVLVVVLVVL